MDVEVKEVNNEAEKEKVFALRKKVFVEEQNVSPELEWDKYDKEAIHVLARSGKETIGCGRIVFFANRGKIGRVAVAKEYRRKGIGSKVCRKLIKIAADRKDCDRIVLHAQVSSRGFYEKLGFKPVGDKFMEAGIEHIKMIKKIKGF